MKRMLLHGRMKRGMVSAMAAGLALWGWSLAAAAQGGDAILLDIGEGMANPGGTAEVRIQLTNGTVAPSVIVIFLAYDPALVEPFQGYYEFILRDLDGNPIRDEQGNVILSTGAVRPEAALAGLGKVIQTGIGPEGQLPSGVMSIGIQGVNATVIPSGALVTVAFRVKTGAPQNGEAAITGITSANPVNIGGTPTFSSAARPVNGGQAEEVPVTLDNGLVTIGCFPAGVPTGVSATQDRPNAVVVSWNAVAEPGAEYRVFRSAQNDVATAQPLGDSWSPETTFTDLTAAAPTVTQPGGCICTPPQVTVNPFFYWVKARTVPVRCEGAFSDPPAQGFRSAAKAASAEAVTKAGDFPRGDVPSAGTAPAIWIEASSPIDPASLWGAVEIAAAGDPGSAVSVDSGEVLWIPAEAEPAKAGWVKLSGVDAAEGEVATFTVGGATVTGEGIGPHVRKVAGAAAKFAPSGTLDELDERAFPWLEQGVGGVYAIGPDGVFDAPVTVAIPVPEDGMGQELVLYFYNGAGGDRRWYLAEQVRGFLAEAPRLRLDGGRAQMEITVRHSGIVQIGTPLSAGAAETAPAPAAITPHTVGDLILWGVLGALLLIARGWTRRLA